MRIRRLSLLLLALVIALATPLRVSASMIFISQEDNGREITLDRGDALQISLPATAGTGYTWQAEPIAGAIVKQIGEPTFKSDSAKPGGSGQQTFVFAFGAIGSGSLEMRYVRPWEKNVRPAKVFKILITVH